MNLMLGAMLVTLSLSQPFTGREWLSHAAESTPGYEEGITSGYLRGVLDASAKNLCHPQAIELGSIQIEVIKWMRAHPDRLNEDASELIQAAVNETVAVQ